MRRAPATLAALAATLLALPAARADEASGTWTGSVELRGNYYWETSTRVVAPEVRARIESPEGVRIDADHLVDAITSASIAAGVQEDIRFTEVRNQGVLGVSRELDLGEAQLRLGSAGRLSHEPDYLATAITAYSALSLARRTTVLSLALTYVHDEVGAVVRGGEARVDDTGRDLSDRGRQGQLEAFTAVLTWNQVLSPIATLVTSYQLVHDWGYLQNPYRRARVGGGLQQELHPGARTRHTLSGRLAWFIPQTSTAIHLGYRAYVDDWDVAAINPEVRLYQMIGRSIVLRLRYRYHNQLESFFYSPEYAGDESYFSADQKMTAFDSHMVGAQLRVGLDFLTHTPLSFLDRAWLDVSFNYWFQTSGFGNGVLAQAGLRAPF
ncbi:MAG: DUF3570 domain-containing protein [Sandaracinaceae bacterium]|nr:DUF3570 domain-containing protein [Sandaracinaceae bacterium]